MNQIDHCDLIYGTAWKEELTMPCVLSALRLGYRAIDSANQRKHYFEAGVGKALEKAKSDFGISRADLFLQTKFTPARGQDHRKPYDEGAPLRDQVIQSFNDSLVKLKTDHLDSYLLHGPSSSEGLTEDDLEIWRAMEELYRSGKAKTIGISNVNRDQLSKLFDVSSVKPYFVQNRCLALSRWDKDVREFCREKGIRYQGFSLLTNNWKYTGGTILRPETRTVPQLVFNRDETRETVLHPPVKRMVEELGEPIQRIIFRFAQQLNIIPILGSRSEEHLKMNLNLKEFTLSDQQIELLENIAFEVA